MQTGARRLQAVLLADMTGFSRLMGEDEARAVAALMRVRDVFSAVVPRHRGSLDVLVGDCFVALFDSAVDAVQAAIGIQIELAGAAGPAGDPVRIRIGVHLGEVVRSARRFSATASTWPPGCRRSRVPAASPCPKTCTAPCAIASRCPSTTSGRRRSRTSARRCGCTSCTSRKQPADTAWRGARVRSGR
jgi:class 3 adenylate cyclase